MEGEKLAKAILNAMPRAKNNFLFGVVTNVSPLEIQVNDFPLIKESMIVLGRNCVERITYIDKHTHIIPAHQTEPEPLRTHIHPIEPWETEETDRFVVVNRGLRVGDTVFMIQSNDNQKYYVCERIGADRD